MSWRCYIEREAAEFLGASRYPSPARAIVRSLPSLGETSGNSLRSADNRIKNKAVQGDTGVCRLEDEPFETFS